MIHLYTVYILYGAALLPGVGHRMSTVAQSGQTPKLAHLKLILKKRAIYCKILHTAPLSQKEMEVHNNACLVVIGYLTNVVNKGYCLLVFVQWKDQECV